MTPPPLFKTESFWIRLRRILSPQDCGMSKTQDGDKRGGGVRNKRGFTLIEMTIMIGVAAVLFISVSRAAQTLVDASVENRNYLVALNLAKNQMAIMNNAAYPAVAAETTQTAISPFTDFIPTQEVVSVATSGGNSIRQITIRIRLGSATGSVLIRLDTYRSNILTFGNGT